MLPLPLFLACAPSPQPGEVAAPSASLDPVGHLVRASLAVRGVRPSIAEIEAVKSDPGALPELVRGWMETDEFGATIRDMWAEILLLRNDTFNQLPALGAMQGYELDDLYQGTVEEPLKLVEYVVMEDRPLTEILTADYVLTDEITAGMYGVPYDFEAGGWQVSAWADDRPKAGLLSSAQLWRRWESDGSNFNRMRANMIAGKFLCEPFDGREIVVEGGIDIADPEAVANAVVESSACANCHQSLDPLAGYFWGYKKLLHRNYVADSINAGCEWDWSEIEPEFGIGYLPEDYCYPLKQYNPAEEDDWQLYGLRTPAFYGEPVRDIRDLGQAIADDPRFSACLARNFAGWLTQTPPLEVPFARATELQQLIVSTNFDAKALVEEIVTDPSFARLADPSGDPTAKLQVVRPEQYARAVEAMTGFRWWSDADRPACDDPGSSDVQRFGTQCWGDVDLTVSDVFGFRAMSGGVDSKVVLEPVHAATPTKTLVMSQLAANAAQYVVNEDFATSASERRLLTLVEASTTDEAAVRDQLARLHLLLLAEDVAAASAEVTDSLALWQLGVDEGGGPEGGWRLVISALLQDPRMMFY